MNKEQTMNEITPAEQSAWQAGVHAGREMERQNAACGAKNAKCAPQSAEPVKHPSYDPDCCQGHKAESDCKCARYDAAAPVKVPNNKNKCWCRTCRPLTLEDMRFVVCPECGNKRCPHANDHRNECTGSNDPGQKGSAYENCAAPVAAQPPPSGNAVELLPIAPSLPLNDPAAAYRALHDYGRQCYKAALATQSDWHRIADERAAEIVRLDGLIAAQASGQEFEADDVREFTNIGKAVNRAAMGLPDGWNIRIELERDAGTVYLSGPGVNEAMIDGGGEPFSEQINSAIDAARAAAKGKASP